MKQILYGVGKCVLKDFVDPKQIVALSKLKDVAINFASEEEAVTGGDSPYPITYFAKDKSITLSATNALFDLKLLNVTQGATVTTGAIRMTEFIEADVPAELTITLENSPIAETTVLEGFEAANDEASLAEGKYFVDTTKKQIKFHSSASGKSVNGIYERESAATAETISILKDTLAKPFTFVHRIPIYNDNSQIIGQGQLTVYKCKASGAFEYNLQPQTAYAPKIELKALDPKRADKKLWDFTIETV
ncbi:hypothetical protein PV797_04915 [Clostridiaceae bacterium M8S5]|nr:hypothetical protein PV797_04915 [Clostridiaceae bacterium M8S5]